MSDYPAHLRPLEHISYSTPIVPTSSKSARPELRWIPLKQLVVDARYQRDILKRGAKNIRTIVEEFDWARFTPVVVAPVDELPGQAYAIIDGQHRSTAALMHPDIDEVPCQVIQVDLSGQAMAFMKINAAVTKVSPLQLYAASLNGEDPEALAIDEICMGADVLVMRYPVPADKLNGGQTLAIGTLKTVYRRYGGKILAAALGALRHADPFGGLVNQHTIKAMASLLGERPIWLQRLDFVKEVLGVAELKAALATAQDRRLANGGSIAVHLEAVILEMLRDASREAA